MQGGTPAPCRAIGPPVVTGSAFHPPGPAAAGLVAGTRGHRHPASGEGSKEPGDTWRGRPVPERSGERRAPRPGPLSGPSPTTEASGAALPSPTCPVTLFCFLPLWALVKIWGNFTRCWTYGAVGLWRGARELTGRPWRARSTRVSSPSPALPTVAHHPATGPRRTVKAGEGSSWNRGRSQPSVYPRGRSREASGVPRYSCAPRPLTPRARLSRLVSYHDAGVGLVVVGGVHTLEPLLAGCVPKVCNRDTALTT